MRDVLPPALLTAAYAAAHAAQGQASAILLDQDSDDFADANHVLARSLAAQDATAAAAAASSGAGSSAQHAAGAGARGGGGAAAGAAAASRGASAAAQQQVAAAGANRALTQVEQKKLMLPLLRLRQAACHPQVRRRCPSASRLRA